jgi:hypothetical protein
MRGDERARHARRLSERPHVDDPVAAQAEMRKRAAAVARTTPKPCASSTIKSASCRSASAASSGSGA